jgi:hypothetical protein
MSIVETVLGELGYKNDIVITRICRDFPIGSDVAYRVTSDTGHADKTFQRVVGGAAHETVIRAYNYAKQIRKDYQGS